MSNKVRYQSMGHGRNDHSQCIIIVFEGRIIDITSFPIEYYNDPVVVYFSMVIQILSMRGYSNISSSPLYLVSYL